MKAKIHLQKIQATTLIGFRNHEKKAKQPLIVDAVIEIDIHQIKKNDSIESSVDYSKIVQEIIRYIETSHFQLLESLTYFLANHLLTTFQIESVWLKVNKPLATSGLSDVSIEYFEKCCK